MTIDNKLVLKPIFYGPTVRLFILKKIHNNN